VAKTELFSSFISAGYSISSCCGQYHLLCAVWPIISISFLVLITFYIPASVFFLRDFLLKQQL